MAIQKEVLWVKADGSHPKYMDGTTEKTDKPLEGSKGVLAIGKAGDVISRAYGPVVRAEILTADANFGAYVEGKGILVNSGDCAAISLQFETVKGLKKGQTGSFLVSGACVVPGTAVQTIADAMVVQYLDKDWFTDDATTRSKSVYEIEVNGFDVDKKPSASVA